MSLLGNIVWIIFGGLIIALWYFAAGFILCCTIIGIPFGLQLFKIGLLALLPFGKTIAVGEGDRGCLTTVMNLIWLLIGGLWIVLNHLFWGLLLCITLVGIPFGRQHFKLMRIAFTPFGSTITSP